MKFTDNRPSFTDTFFTVARAFAERATCPRAKVGCVITRDNHILTTGYNGAPHGLPHCLDHQCIIEGGHCVRAAHAETNATAYAARAGISLEGSVAYLTLMPCINCYNLLAQAGIRRIVYLEAYERDEALILQRLSEEAGGVRLVQYHGNAHRGITLLRGETTWQQAPLSE